MIAGWVDPQGETRCSFRSEAVKIPGELGKHTGSYEAFIGLDAGSAAAGWLEAKLQGVQLGPIRARRVSGVAQGALPAYCWTQPGPAPILTRSGVHSGESALAMRA